VSPQRIVATLLALTMMVSGPGFVWPAGAQPVPMAPPGPGGEQAPGASIEVTPPRVSYMNGEVAFWRPGAQDWAPVALNTPLAPGDMLYTGQGGNVEIQIGPRAFVRATNGTQIGLDNQEPNFIQLRVTGGQVALDLRQLPPESTIELDTPNAAFTIERGGYYRADVGQDATSFTTHRGGAAVVTPAGGAPGPIGADQQVILTGIDSPQVTIGAAAQLTAWDSWNYQRTDYLSRAASARYVSSATYGTEALDQYGTWRTAETYGSVWVPSGVPAGWVPYSTGRWIWDPRFGWTWLDEAPWGWAPYHYGRWVFIGNYWAWAPGPVVVGAAYSPALVVFLGGVTLSVGRPLCWAPLAWGEPVIPWWGRAGFVGVPSWHGWGGPRVVNNTVINRNTTVNVTNINVYRNVTTANAVIGVPADRFGHGDVRPARINQGEARQLRPIQGPLEVRPVAASVMPATGHAPRPPAALHERTVVATRAPHDVTPTLRSQGLAAAPAAAPAPRLVPAPKRGEIPPNAPWEPRTGRRVTPDEGPGAARPAPQGPQERRGNVERERPAPLPPGSPQTATPPPQPGPEQRRGTGIERPTPPPPPGSAQPGPEQRRSPAVERPAPPRAATPPGPEQRRGDGVERSVPPPPPGAAPPGPEQRRGGIERSTQPPPPPGPAQPEQRRGPAVERPAPPPGSPRTVTPPPQPGPEQRRGPAIERPTPPPPPGGQPGAGPEQRRGPAVERPMPPPQGRQAPPAQPGPEQRRGPEDRSAPPPTPAPQRQAPPNPNTSGLDPRRGHTVERPTPPPQAPPRMAAPPAPAPEQRRTHAAIERPATPPPPAPRQAASPAQPAPRPEQYRERVQRPAPPVPGPSAAARPEPRPSRPAPAQPTSRGDQPERAAHQNGREKEQRQ
jgi:hypothetical protein